MYSSGFRIGSLEGPFLYPGYLHGHTFSHRPLDALIDAWCMFLRLLDLFHMYGIPFPFPLHLLNLLQIVGSLHAKFFLMLVPFFFFIPSLLPNLVRPSCIFTFRDWNLSCRALESSNSDLRFEINVTGRRAMQNDECVLQELLRKARTTDLRQKYISWPKYTLHLFI